MLVWWKEVKQLIASDSCRRNNRNPWDNTFRYHRSEDFQSNLCCVAGWKGVWWRFVR